MADSLTINEVVRCTGLTSRALRFYEARGLLAPLRTGSGRRVYSAAQIGRLFDNKLLAPFSKVATPEMWQGTTRLYQAMPEWEGQVDPGFSAEVWGFIWQATAAAQKAGHDIGPMPPWMEQQEKEHGI